MQTATAGVPALVRLGTAAFVAGNLKNFRKRPSKPIEMYEFEGCPFCRKVNCLAGTLWACAFALPSDSEHTYAMQVREACTLLDIDVLFYPCPKGGPTWRPKVCFIEKCTTPDVWSWSSSPQHAPAQCVRLVYADPFTQCCIVWLARLLTLGRDVAKMG